MSPQILTFTDCGVVVNATFTSNTANGDGYTISSFSMSGGKVEGTFNYDNADFILKVTAPAGATPPSVTPNVSGTLGQNGWYTSDVTVSWTVSDSESTPSYSCPPTTIITETTGQTVTCTATSLGGSTTGSVTIKLDKTGPTAGLAVTAGTAGANGWYTSNVTVHASGSDSISGPVTCTPDQYQATETTGVTFSGSCTNDAGLSTDAASLTIKLDKTGPSATLSAVGTLGNNGWYVSDVTIKTTGNDSISTPVTCTPDQSQTTDTLSATFNGSCTNDAGLKTDAAPLTVKRDVTPPVVALKDGPVDGGSYYFGFVPAAPTCTASDATSGPAGACTVSGYGAAVGTHTVTANATDNAGNSNSASATYEVKAWTLNGFYQPVDMNGVYNVVKGGSTVPLKFEVFAGPTELTDVSVVDSFTQAKVTCDGSALTDEVEVTTTGGTSLRYDTTGGQFIQNWQTPKLSGTCYRVTMKTDDGSSLVAFFKLK